MGDAGCIPRVPFSRRVSGRRPWIRSATAALLIHAWFSPSGRPALAAEPVIQVPAVELRLVLSSGIENGGSPSANGNGRGGGVGENGGRNGRLPLQVADQLTEPGEPYRDRVIDEEALDSPDWLPYGTTPEPEGQRFFAIEARGYVRDISTQGRLVEYGGAVLWRRETRDYGELYLDAEYAGFELHPNDLPVDRTTGGVFRFAQNRFPLTERLLMDNTLGVQYALSNPLLANSYRVSLPSPVISGGATVTYGEGSELRLAGGNFGRLEGIYLRDFERTSGTLVGGGLMHGFSPSWSVGGQLWNVNASREVPDHVSGALMVQYQSPDQSRKIQARGLQDSKGHLGLWLDGLERVRYWQHHYGIYRFEPDLLWTDTTVGADQQGVYWRSDLATARETLSLGIDLSESNVEDRPQRGGAHRQNYYLGGSLRLDRGRYIGGSVTVDRSRAKNRIAGDPVSTGVIGQAYLSQLLPIGMAQLQYSFNERDGEPFDSRSQGLSWNQEWLSMDQVRLSTNLGYFSVRDVGIDGSRREAGMTGYYYAGSSLSFNASLNYSEQRMDNGFRADNLNGSLAAAWRMTPRLSGILQATYGRQQASSALFAGTDNSVLLILRYEQAEGQPYGFVGMPGGGHGYGNITGRVFYDENDDGLRQANERPAAGVMVFLDGRFPVQTDSQGQFLWNAVPAGEHEVSLVTQGVPLPWGLADELPRRVAVQVRGEAFLEIPLQRVRP